MGSWNVIAFHVVPWACPQCSFTNEESYHTCNGCGFAGMAEFSVEVPAQVKSRALEMQKVDRKARLANAFKGKTTNIFTPVIHVEDEKQALRNVQIAVDAGADGVWLINHGIPFASLGKIGAVVRRANQELFIGINALDLREDVFHKIAALPWQVDGVWTDSVEATFTDAHPWSVYHSWARAASGWTGLFFGGACFKYQADYTTDHAKAKHVLDAASNYVDVLVTSGPGTGFPMPIWKGTFLRHNSANAPTAIASGVSVNNLQSYAGYTDVFMVASSISSSFSELDEAKVKELASAIQSLALHPHLPTESTSNPPPTDVDTLASCISDITWL